jgi:hypothetical protein
MLKNARESMTVRAIEQKFTPPLPKIPLLSRVAPNKESIILPKKPKNAEMYRKFTSKGNERGFSGSIINTKAAKDSIDIETDDNSEATVPSRETPPSVPGSTVCQGLIIITGFGESTPISLAMVSALAAAIDVVKATKACSGCSKPRLYPKATIGGMIPLETTLEPPLVPAPLSSTPRAIL